MGLNSFVVSVSAVAVCGGVAAGSLSSIGPTDFGGTPEEITFDEVPVDTLGPFSIGAATFSAGVIVDEDSLAPPSDAGAPYLFTLSSGADDAAEVTFDYGMTAVGAYFDLRGSGFTVTTMELEFYNGATLLGTVAAVPTVGSGVLSGGWVGGETDGDLITRVVFRDTDPPSGISFRIDDLRFIPTPGTAALLGLAGIAGIRRRR